MMRVHKAAWLTKADEGRSKSTPFLPLDCPVCNFCPGLPDDSKVMPMREHEAHHMDHASFRADGKSEAARRD